MAPSVTPLRVFLAAAGIRQRQLAEMVGVHPNYLCAVVAGRREASLRLRRSIAMALDVDESHLFPDA